MALTRNNPYGALPALGGVGAVVFVACAMLWGARASGNSILAEIADRERHTHLRYLAEVLAAEVDDRTERRRARRINDAV